MGKIFNLAALAVFCLSLNAKEIDVNLIKAAQKEGRVNSLAMPDTWANWKDTWSDLKRLYGLEHSDTDMS